MRARSCGSHLLLDETGLEAGKLNESGLKNVNAISQLLSKQSVCYDFQYHQTEMLVDFPSVVVSTAKSLFAVGLLAASVALRWR
jgi:Mini-chromosome maintenance replisome factor